MWSSLVLHWGAGSLCVCAINGGSAAGVDTAAAVDGDGNVLVLPLSGNQCSNQSQNPTQCPWGHAQARGGGAPKTQIGPAALTSLLLLLLLLLPTAATGHKRTGNYCQYSYSKFALLRRKSQAALHLQLQTLHPLPISSPPPKRTTSCVQFVRARGRVRTALRGQRWYRFG